METFRLAYKNKKRGNRGRNIKYEIFGNSWLAK
jgi:hypothetical protein